MSIQKHYLLLLAAALVLGACSDETPESKSKPIPVKKVAGAPSEGVDLDKSMQEAQAQGKDKPTGTEPVRALKARPPTSGKEPMVMLGKNKLPLTEMVQNTIKLNYYECKGVVADWFLELVVAEMNYFAELAELPFVNGVACIVSVGTDKSLTPGRISINLYSSLRQLNDCVKSEVCPTFRSVNLVERGPVLYRSYFLSDMSRKLINQHCVTDKGKWHRDITCYEVD